MLNQEIEAHYVQYLYLISLDEFYEPGNKWQQWYIADPRMKEIANLNEIIDDSGNLRETETKDNLEKEIKKTIEAFQEDPSYQNYKYDSTRDPLYNFRNLRQLNK